MATVRGSCLCGDVAWQVEGPLQMMSHCHCARCRKAHGAAFATYVVCAPEDFTLVRGGERIARFESSPGFVRPFCSRCGSVVPDGEPWEGVVGMPAGPFDDDPGIRPQAHIFVGSKAPWLGIHDDLPQLDGYPSSFAARALPDRPPPLPPTDGIRGSCLCGGVAWVVTGELLRCWNCHCSRCRKARAAAHATNLFTTADGLRVVRGEDLAVTFKVPDARFFQQVFCRICGAGLPRVDHGRNLAISAMGSLDDDPGIRPERHIFVASRAPWFEIADDLPQHAEYPPPG